MFTKTGDTLRIRWEPTARVGEKDRGSRLPGRQCRRIWVQRRELAAPGSIPAALGMFVAEVRCYRQIAPVVGVRRATCGRRGTARPERRPEAVAWAERLSARARRFS